MDMIYVGARRALLKIIKQFRTSIDKSNLQAW